MPATVHFVPGFISSISRAPTLSEFRVLEDFEYHAATCRRCKSISLAEPTLCRDGTSLAARISKILYKRRKKYYSLESLDNFAVVVEVPPYFKSARVYLHTPDINLS